MAAGRDLQVVADAIKHEILALSIPFRRQVVVLLELAVLVAVDDKHVSFTVNTSARAAALYSKRVVEPAIAGVVDQGYGIRRSAERNFALAVPATGQTHLRLAVRVAPGFDTERIRLFAISDIKVDGREIDVPPVLDFLAVLLVRVGFAGDFGLNIQRTVTIRINV